MTNEYESSSRVAFKGRVEVPVLARRLGSNINVENLLWYRVRWPNSFVAATSRSQTSRNLTANSYAYSANDYDQTSQTRATTVLCMHDIYPVLGFAACPPKRRCTIPVLSLPVVAISTLSASTAAILATYSLRLRQVNIEILRATAY